MKYTMVIVGGWPEMFQYNSVVPTTKTGIEFEKGGVVENTSNNSYIVGKHFGLPAIPIVGFKGDGRIIDIIDFVGITYSNFQEYIRKKLRGNDDNHFSNV